MKLCNLSEYSRNELDEVSNARLIYYLQSITLEFRPKHWHVLTASKRQIIYVHTMYTTAIWSIITCKKNPDASPSVNQSRAQK